MRHSLTVLLTAAALGLPLSGQGPAADPDAAADLPLHKVFIDAILTDARGRIIENLRAGDFDLHEDGEQRTIDTAEFVRLPPAGGSSNPATSRWFAIYIDEYHISAGASTTRARQAINRFISQALNPNDLIVVMKPLESLFDIHMTHDLETAAHVALQLEGRRDDLTPRNDYEKNFMAGDPARIAAARDQVALSAINALAVNLSQLGAGRKSLIVVTESLSRPPRGRGQEYLATLEQGIRSANRSNTSVYVVDPREGPVDQDDPGRAAMVALANQTDGALIANADLDSGLQRVARESGAYYLIGYQARHKEDGGFHRVQLRVNRPGIKVRAREGYWAPSVDDRLRAEVLARNLEPKAPPPPEPPRHISPFIAPWFGLARGDKGLTRVTFVWEPTARVLGERNQQSASRVELTALGPDDRVLFDGPVLPTGGTTSEPTDSRAIFDAVPGRLRLRMKIQNQARQQIDTDVRDINVRDLRTPFAIGTPQVFRARNAREVRLIGADPQAAPVAARDFSRTEELVVRFPIYGPAGSLTPSARLLNRLGQVMRELPVETPPALNGWKQLGLPLASLAPGEYMIELSAKGEAGEARDRLTFRVAN
jgi:VWFA-related protein